MDILCEYCMNDKWIGDGRTPCPKCNPNGEIEEEIWCDDCEKYIEDCDC